MVPTTRLGTGPAVAEGAAPTAPKVHLLDLAGKLLSEKNLTPELEKALQHLHDDEFEGLTRDEKRAFWGEAVRRELVKNGVAKGALAMSGLNSNEASTSAALAQLAKQDPKVGQIGR